MDKLKLDQATLRTEKSKIEASVLIAITFAIFGFFIFMYFRDDSSLLLPAILALASFISILLVIVWDWDYLNHKIKDAIKFCVHLAYVFLFFWAWFFFLKGIESIFTVNFNRNANALSLIVPLILVLFFLISYMESIWKFSGKSLSRKYFNAIYFITGTTFWQFFRDLATNDYGIAELEFGSLLLLMLYAALFSYIISLLIAAVEFYRSRKIKPKD